MRLQRLASLVNTPNSDAYLLQIRHRADQLARQRQGRSVAALSATGYRLREGKREHSAFYAATSKYIDDESRPIETIR